MENQFYILNKSTDPWGDYGNILTHGMSAHRGRNKDGLIQLERCGPFIPPISMPGIGDIVVTQSFRNELLNSPLKGFEFRPVSKLHIVKNSWHDGSRNRPEPFRYPKGGKPEEYILALPHDRDVATQMGELWELVPNKVCYTTRARRIVSSRKEITLVTENWDGSDIFRADGVAFNYISQKARDWFEAHVPELVTFEDAVTSPVPPPDQNRE